MVKDVTEIQNIDEKSKDSNPYFLSFENSSSGYNKSVFEQYIRVFKVIIVNVWPSIHKTLTFIVFDGLRFFKSFIRFALKQIGILK